MKCYTFIKDHREMFEIQSMCRVLKVSRNGYYAWRKRGKSAREKANAALLVHIRVAHKRSRLTYGSPRITKELKAKGIRCIENRVARLMRREGICAKMVKKFKMITDSDHTYPVFPNLLKQNFYAPGPNQVWVSDITYNPNRPRVAVPLRSGGPVLPTDCGVCH